MECSICYEAYDQAARTPKIVVPCGHTVCLQCLQRCDRRQCPTCRTAYNVTPESLLKNIALLQLMEQQDIFRAPRGWCSDCRAAAARRCWDEHAVLNATAAKRKLGEQVPAGALQEAAALLQDLQCQGEEVLHALALLSEPSWDLTLRAGSRQLHGTLANAEDPLTKALWVLLATKAALTEDRGAVQDPPPAAALSNAAPDPPPAEAPPPRDMSVHSLRLTAPGDRLEEKAAALQQAQGVVRLVNVLCNYDPAWSLQLLQCAAPTVERLEVLTPREAHLRAVHAMPRLRRLYVRCDHALDAQPPELGELPPECSGLRWLHVRLPLATTLSLLRAHASTLEVLELPVGTPGEEEWPYSCSDLHYLLRRCRLRALRRLVLLRWVDSRVDCSHTDCGEQRATVRATLDLPGLQVLCGECDGVLLEDP